MDRWQRQSLRLGVERALVSLAIAAAIAGCRGTPGRGVDGGDGLAPGVEARSLLGEDLTPPALTAEERAKREGQLDDARAAWESAPRDADATIWLGRRLAYLGRFREAVATFTLGVREHPGDARFLRHRGHRWITLRDFDRAAADLERAAILAAGRPDEVEPDGLPNAAGVPLETLKSNVFYHLGLAHYLRGHFESARYAFGEAQRLAANDDNRCSATHWLYMSLRRLGRLDEAQRALDPVRGELNVLEYRSYESLCRLYLGQADPDALLAEARLAGLDSVEFATVAYGIGAWHLYNGRAERAREIFREVVAGSMWPAFGHIAAEAELARARR